MTAGRDRHFSIVVEWRRPHQKPAQAVLAQSFRRFECGGCVCVKLPAVLSAGFVRALPQSERKKLGRAGLTPEECHQTFVRGQEMSSRSLSPIGSTFIRFTTSGTGQIKRPAVNADEQISDFVCRRRSLLVRRVESRRRESLTRAGRRGCAAAKLGRPVRGLLLPGRLDRSHPTYRGG